MVTWACLVCKLSNPSLDILGVRFDCKLTFESHVHGVVSRVSQRIGIVRMVNGVYADTSVLLRCYYVFILPILEYCSHVWGSAASSHLRRLDRQIHAVSRLCPYHILKPLLLRCWDVYVVQNSEQSETVYMVSCLQPVRG